MSVTPLKLTIDLGELDPGKIKERKARAIQAATEEMLATITKINQDPEVPGWLKPAWILAAVEWCSVSPPWVTVSVRWFYRACWCLGAVFVLLRLAEVITWSWWWVMAPFMGPFALLLLLYVVLWLFIGFCNVMIWRNQRRMRELLFRYRR